MTGSLSIPVLRALVVPMIALCLLALPRAALADLFTVPGVIVAISANSSAEARALGRAEANREGFRRLAERLVVPEDLAAVPDVAPERIEATLASVTVLDEVVTGTTFDGRFTLQFDPAQTRALLRELGLRFTEVQSRPFVIVPVLGQGEGATLWDDPNPWLNAWQNYAGAGDSLVPLIVPLGDIKDVVAIDAARALSGDSRGLADLAGNYDAAGSVVGEAEVTGAPEQGGAALIISLSVYGESLGSPAPVSLAQRTDETAPAFYQRGVIAVAQALEAAWKQANAVQFGASSSLEVRALASALPDWLLIQRALQAEPLVSDLQVRTMQRGSVLIAFTHRGTTEQLQRALSQRGLSLLQAPGGWDLQLGGVGAAGGVDARPLPAPPASGSEE
ncbi:MAG: DUF2066 domain-containing protein [Pseudomonadota bacterium]